MKKIIIIVAVIVAGLIGLVLLSPKATESDKQATPELTFAKVQQDVDNKAQLYDVRTPEEYQTSHFKNATNFPLQTLLAGTMPDVAKDTKIYVYCQSGNRSAQATTVLKQNGFTNVVDLHGLSDVTNIGGKLI